MLRKVCLSLAVVAASIVAAGEASAQEFVSGHYRHNAYGGSSYVRPHYRTHADTSFYTRTRTSTPTTARSARTIGPAMGTAVRDQAPGSGAGSVGRRGVVEWLPP